MSNEKYLDHRQLPPLDKGAVQKVDLMMIDSGGTLFTSVDCLYPLKEHFSQEPAMALLCSLHRIKPLNVSWSLESMAFFVSQCSGLTATFHVPSDNESLTSGGSSSLVPDFLVTLTKTERIGQHSKTVDIKSLLIQERHAVLTARDGCSSRQSSSVRQAVTLPSPSPAATPSVLSQSQDPVQSPVQQEQATSCLDHCSPSADRNERIRMAHQMPNGIQMTPPFRYFCTGSLNPNASEFRPLCSDPQFAQSAPVDARSHELSRPTTLLAGSSSNNNHNKSAKKVERVIHSPVSPMNPFHPLSNAAVATHFRPRFPTSPPSNLPPPPFVIRQPEPAPVVRTPNPVNCVPTAADVDELLRSVPPRPVAASGIQFVAIPSINRIGTAQQRNTQILWFLFVV